MTHLRRIHVPLRRMEALDWQIRRRTVGRSFANSAISAALTIQFTRLGDGLIGRHRKPIRRRTGECVPSDSQRWLQTMLRASEGMPATRLRSSGWLRCFYWRFSPRFRTGVRSVGAWRTASSDGREDLPGLTCRSHAAPTQQRAIADYLDRETARLDALVAAKERVLGLLAEKRRALITRAVTRGLDPAPPSATPASPGSARFRRIGRLSARGGCSRSAISAPTPGKRNSSPCRTSLE